MQNLKFNVLSKQEIETLHESSLEILECVGVKINNKKVYDMVVDAGAKPGKENILYLSAELVASCLKQCPASADICDMAGNKKVLGAGGDQVFFTSNAYNWVDENNQVQDIKTNDFISYIKVVNSLENVFGMVGTNLSELPVPMRDVSGFKLMIENTKKHIRPCIYTPEGVDVILEMSRVILNSREYKEYPFFSFGYTAVSPLQWSDEACEIFMRSSGQKIPLMINAEPLSGGTSPVTLAGSIALANAEVLSGIVINQVIEPGRPLIYNIGIAHMLDMRSSISLTGSPENSLIAASGAQIARYYDIPSASWMNTDALCVDGQAVLEKAHTIQSHTLSGVNMIWGVGNMESTLCFSPTMAIIDDEIIGTIRRIQKGIKVSEETLAMNIIKQVGFSGDFLSTDHTFEHFRTELRDSRLLNRIRREAWVNANSPKFGDNVKGKLKEILSVDNESFIDKKVISEISRIEKAWLEKVRSNS